MKGVPPARAALVYDPGLRALHWLMAALILVALPLGSRWRSCLAKGCDSNCCLSINRSA